MDVKREICEFVDSIEELYYGNVNPSDRDIIKGVRIHTY